MEEDARSATDRAFGTPELLEQVLIVLLGHTLPIRWQEDPRSVRTSNNSDVLTHLLHCSEVSRVWRECMLGSKRLQRALFLLPDDRSSRSWHHNATAQSEKVRQMSYYRAPPLQAPNLNPIIQTIFNTYHFRFWHLSLEVSGNKHCAYLIITRRDLPALQQRSETGQGKTITNMLLSQPPCTVLEATIWEERDETKDYVGRTTALQKPIISCEDGLTIGMVHERVGEMFREYADVAAIKLTTV